MLKIEHLTKMYKGGEKGIKDICLEIEDGDIYGFIGPNGAGKTTTLKCVTGLLTIDSGEIFVDGTSVKADPIGCKEKMAYVPDNPEIYDNLTGIQFLNFVSDIYQVSADDRSDRIKKYAQLFGIEGDLGSTISGYSHGMKQKLVIISALLHQPKLMILDEPFVGLDPSAAYDVKEVMKDLCAQGGAVFYSTHVLEVAEKLCNKIAIIRDGVIIRSGPTKEVIGDESLEQLFMELVER